MADEKETKSSEEQVSETKEETASTEAEPQTPQPLTEERVQQLIAEQTELVRRQTQSEKDKAIAEIRREAEKQVRRAQTERDTIKSTLKGYDPESGRDINELLEVAESKGQREYYESLARDEEQRKGFETYRQQLQGSLKSHLESLGIDPEDKRIDWAENESDFLTGRSKFDASVAKILKENQGAAEKRMKDDFKQLEATLRRELNLDSVETTTAAGGGDSDAEFLDKFGKGEVPYTKENKERAEKLMK